MPLTVWPFFFVAVHLANSFHRRYAQAISQAEAQGALRARSKTLAVILRYARRRAAIYSNAIAIIVTIFNLIALALSGELSLDFDGEWYRNVVDNEGQVARQSLTTTQVIFERLVLFLVMMIAGYLAGLKLGVAVSYGLLLTSPNRGGLAIRLIPGHPDKSSGLQPIGKYISFQALLAATPAFWLAFWLLIIPHTSKLRYLQDYTNWLASFTSTLFLAVCISVLAFYLPLRSINRRMLELRTRLVDRYRPELSAQIRSLYERIGDGHTSISEMISARAELTTLQDSLYKIETTPVWPLDPFGIIRFLTIAFVILFVPIIQAYEQYAQEEGALQFFFVFFNAFTAFIEIFF